MHFLRSFENLHSFSSASNTCILTHRTLNCIKKIKKKHFLLRSSLNFLERRLIFVTVLDVFPSLFQHHFFSCNQPITTEIVNSHLSAELHFLLVLICWDEILGRKNCVYYSSFDGSGTKLLLCGYLHLNPSSGT